MIVELEAGEEEWTRLFQKRESMARIVRILKAIETEKCRVDLALAYCYSARMVKHELIF